MTHARRHHTSSFGGQASYDFADADLVYVLEDRWAAFLSFPYPNRISLSQRKPKWMPIADEWT
jgi:hypothetical protein